MATNVFVEFNDHVESDDRRLILAFLNALSGATEVVGKPSYIFVITRPSRMERLREGLSNWERDGLIQWREEPGAQS